MAVITSSNEMGAHVDCGGAVEQFIVLAKLQVDLALSEFGVTSDKLLSTFGASSESSGNVFESVLQTAEEALKQEFNGDPAASSVAQSSLSAPLKAFPFSGLVGDGYGALDPLLEIGDATITSLSAAFNAKPVTKFVGYEPGQNSQFFNKSSVGVGCADNQYAATVAGVVKGVTGTIKVVTGEVAKAQAFGASILKGEKYTMDALVRYMAGLLDGAYSTEIVFLELMNDQIKKMNKVMEGIKEDDLKLKHKDVVRAARLTLTNARFAFNRVFNKLEAAQGFDSLTYDAGRALIAEAEDILQGAPGFAFQFSLKPIELLVHLQGLIAIRTAWIKAQRQREEIKRGLFEFETGLDLKPDNLLAPMFALIRCRLEYLISDMSATLQKNDLLLYYARERAWRVALRVLRETVRALESVFDIGGKVYKPLFQLSFDLIKGLRTAKNLLVQAKPLDQRIKDYIDNVYKLLRKQTFRAPNVIVRGESIIQFSEIRINELKSNKELIEKYLGSNFTEILSAIAAVNQWTEFLTGSDIPGVVNMVRSGRFGEIFSDSPVFYVARNLRNLFDNTSECLVAPTDPTNLALQRKLQIQFIDDVSERAYLSALKNPDIAESRRNQYRRRLAARRNEIGQVYKSTAPSIDFNSPIDASLLGEVLSLSNLDITDFLDGLTQVDPNQAGAYGTPSPEDSFDLDQIDATAVPEITTNALATGEKPVWWVSGINFPLTFVTTTAVQLPKLRIAATEYQRQQLIKLLGIPSGADESDFLNKDQLQALNNLATSLVKF